MTPVEMQESLRKLGIESKMVTYTNKRATGLEWQVNGIVWTYDWYGERPQALRTYMHYSPEQAIAATVGSRKTKAYPWGYESSTGYFDVTRCECGALNDISAKFCNKCGCEIEIETSEKEYAEEWYTPSRILNVNGDGTLTDPHDGKTYIAATVGDGTCHMEVHDNLAESEGMGDVWLECDKCHWQMMLEPTTPRLKYCPNCGRRIEDEAECQ